MISGGATISPAYGRDYNSAQDAEDDFIAGKDFELHSLFHGGTYCSIRDFAPATRVNIRYAHLTKVTPLTVTSTMLEKQKQNT